jgi:hypothetical protein
MSARKPGLFSSALRVIRNLWLIAREFDDPLRSLLVGLAANSVDLDKEQLRLLKPFDAPYRNQCLAMLIGLPGFNLKKAVELLPLYDPLRTQALMLLASTPSLDVQSVFALYYFDEPFRSQCFAYLVKDPSLDVAQFRHARNRPANRRSRWPGHRTLAAGAVRLEVSRVTGRKFPAMPTCSSETSLGSARASATIRSMRAAPAWLLHSQRSRHRRLCRRTRSGWLAAAVS